MAPAADKQPITRRDLEQRFGAFQSRIQDKVESRKATLGTVAAVAATIVLMVVFLLGRRAGKRTRTLVEVRRL